MAEIDIDVDGLERVQREVAERRRDLHDTETWYVGTAVEYSIYLEFGTRDMDPKPFLRPALLAYKSNFEAAFATDTNLTVGDIGTPAELVRAVAFALERRIKRIITRKGLVDTGTLRASVQAVPVPTDLPTEEDIDLDDEGNAIDPRAQATFEVAV